MGYGRQLICEGLRLLVQYVSGLVGGYLGFMLAARGASVVLSYPNNCGVVALLVGWPAGNLAGILLTDKSGDRKGWKRILGIVAALGAYCVLLWLVGGLMGNSHWPLAAPLVMVVGYRMGFWIWKRLFPSLFKPAL